MEKIGNADKVLRKGDHYGRTLFYHQEFSVKNQYLNHHTILHLCEVFHSGVYPDCWLF